MNEIKGKQQMEEGRFRQMCKHVKNKRMRTSGQASLYQY
jgi:hypothetical protein